MAQITIVSRESHSNLSADLQKLFTARDLYRVALGQGMQLFKLTSADAASSGHVIARSGPFVTPWWFCHEAHALSTPEGRTLDVPGMGKDLERARRVQRSLTDFARSRAAVNKAWKNPMDYVLVVQLYRPVDALLGRCAAQGYSAEPKDHNVVFIGGALQLHIPTLAASDVRVLQHTPV